MRTKDFILETYKNYKLSKETTELIEKFLNSSVKYVMGRNEHSKELCKIFKIDYVIDDFTQEKEFYGSKIIKSEEIPSDKVVVSCVTSIYSFDAVNKLNKMGIQTINLSDLSYYLPQKVPFPKFIQEQREVFENNIEKFKRVYNALEDEKSKKTFEDVLLFRLTGNAEFLKDYKVELKEQYFKHAEFLDLGKNPVFVDCGGFDGDTSFEFINRYPNYKKIYFFEPNHVNITKAKQRLQNYKNIEYIEKGVSDKEETLYFSSSGSASQINKNGDIKIETVRIDDYVKENDCFIKMDLEGWEMPAIVGGGGICKAKFTQNGNSSVS